METFKNYKQKLVDLKGGKCEICGFIGDARLFDFHHLFGKSFNISKRPKGIGWHEVLIELSKCILVCSLCHRKLHIGKITLEDCVKDKAYENTLEMYDLKLASYLPV